MANIQFNVTVSTPFAVASLELPVQTHTIQVALQEGDHIFTSTEFQLGTVKHLGIQPLIAQIVFRYKLDSSTATVTICDTDYPSNDGMKLITTLQNVNESCIEHAANIGAIADEGARNFVWNYRSQLMPGAADELKSIVCGANESLKEALGAGGNLYTQLRQMLPPLPREDYLSLCPVYRGGQFLELHDSTKQYEESDVLSPVESSFRGLKAMPKGTSFANILGSTPDSKYYPKGYVGFINLWEDKTNTKGESCTSWKWGTPNPFPCTDPKSRLFGGHILFGATVAAERAPDADDVYILPICNAHNNVRYTSAMQAQSDIMAVWLGNYLQPDPTKVASTLT